ncbi:hypothetical protein [Bosea sp. (in: a-proteobacteria)]|uniref:hypothetical protein n=1 Tax=Bosea sp. (in: a-proteobacteria) TaxID=1871050 RepID=UPI0027358660|nr:hypothetical protein [Bosea sp. (in: a-proteobacteria)]
MNHTGFLVGILKQLLAEIRPHRLVELATGYIQMEPTRFQLEEAVMDRRSFLAALMGAVAVGSTASLMGVSDASASTSVIGAAREIDIVKGTLDEVEADFAKGGNGKGWKRGNRGRHLGWGRGRRRRRHGRRGYGRRFY